MFNQSALEELSCCIVVERLVRNIAENDESDVEAQNALKVVTGLVDATLEITRRD